MDHQIKKKDLTPTWHEKHPYIATQQELSIRKNQLQREALPGPTAHSTFPPTATYHVIETPNFQNGTSRSPPIGERQSRKAKQSTPVD